MGVVGTTKTQAHCCWPRSRANLGAALHCLCDHPVLPGAACVTMHAQMTSTKDRIEGEERGEGRGDGEGAREGGRRGWGGEGSWNGRQGRWRVLQTTARIADNWQQQSTMRRPTTRQRCCLSLTHHSVPGRWLRGCYSARGCCLCCLLALLFLCPPLALRPRPRPRPLFPCWREPTSCGGRKCGAWLGLHTGAGREPRVR